MQGQPGETIVAHRVTTEQEARDLVSLEGEDVLTHATLQHLQETKLNQLSIFFAAILQGVHISQLHSEFDLKWKDAFQEHREL